MWTYMACTCPAPNILINVFYKVSLAGVSCGWVWRFWGILTSPTLEVIWALWGRKKLCLESTLQQNVAFFLLFPQGKTRRVFLCFPRLFLLRKNKKKSMQLKLLTAWHGRQAPRGEKTREEKTGITFGSLPLVGKKFLLFLLPKEIPLIPAWPPTQVSILLLLSSVLAFKFFHSDQTYTNWSLTCAQCLTPC